MRCARPFMGLLGLALSLLAAAPALAQAHPAAAPAAVSTPAVSTPASCPTGNLLAGKRPWHTTDRRGRFPNITDGVAANEGALWDVPLAHVFETGASSVTYDLGEVVNVQAAWVQADANDYYTLWGSLDGQNFRELARVDTADGVHGLRGRAVH